MMNNNDRYETIPLTLRAREALLFNERNIVFYCDLWSENN